MSLDQFACVLS